MHSLNFNDRMRLQSATVRIRQSPDFIPNGKAVYPRGFGGKNGDKKRLSIRTAIEAILAWLW